MLRSELIVKSQLYLNLFPKKNFLENVAKMNFIHVKTEKFIFAKFAKNELYELFSRIIRKHSRPKSVVLLFG